MLADDFVELPQFMALERQLGLRRTVEPDRRPIGVNHYWEAMLFRRLPKFLNIRYTFA